MNAFVGSQDRLHPLHRLRGSHTVLVVEDDPAISVGLKMNMEAEGYHILLAADGETGLDIARTQKPDLMILDIMLPGTNGFEVISTLRRESHAIPIIVLSARTGEMDKVTGLELGAQDYVEKPFHLAELLARVRAVLRHYGTQDVYAFGSVTIDVRARIVRKGTMRIEMTATEFDLLCCLVKARGEALSRPTIFRLVWGPHHRGTYRTVDNFIQQLRAKIEDHPQSPRYLQTVRGIGYRLDT